jgi:hypothetical protein
VKLGRPMEMSHLDLETEIAECLVVATSGFPPKTRMKEAIRK